jgi:hypothetical protein
MKCDLLESWSHHQQFETTQTIQLKIIWVCVLNKTLLQGLIYVTTIQNAIPSFSFFNVLISIASIQI